MYREWRLVAGQPRSIHSKTKNGFTFPEFHSLGMGVSLKKKKRQVITCKNKMEEDFMSHLQFVFQFEDGLIYKHSAYILQGPLLASDII